MYKTLSTLAKRSPKRILSMLTAWSFLFFSQTTGYAMDVVLQWDPNSETDLAGYKVYYGSDPQFTGSIVAVEGASPIVVYNTTATVSGLESGKNYFFAVTAYNLAGAESGFSNVVTVSDPSVLMGDINGDNVVDIVDAMQVMQIAVGKIQPTPAELTRGDVAPIINGQSLPDGNINTGDAIVILSKTVAKAVF